MKKYLFFIGGIIVILGIAAAVYFGTRPTLNASTPAQVEQRFDNKDSFVLVMGDTLCGGCQDYKKTTLNQYVRKYGSSNLVLLYTDSFSNVTAYNQFLAKYNLNYQHSPSTFYVKDGVVIASTTNEMTLSQLVNFINLNK